MCRSRPNRKDKRLRGDFSVFGKMNAKYAPIYVAEFQFRYDNRENEDNGDYRMLALNCAGRLQSIRANTCSRAEKNCCHPPLAPW